jgi:hypothetical protein
VEILRERHDESQKKCTFVVSNYRAIYGKINVGLRYRYRLDFMAGQ